MSFNLQSIQRTKRIRAPKIVIVGPGKIGKTTFAAAAPNSVGILTEQGADAIEGMAFPLCQSLDDVYAAINTLLTEDHDFRYVWLDSLDWCEPMLQEYVCKANGWKNIEAPGYGKGYIAAAEEWRNVLSGFEALRNEKDMGVILIAHDKVKHLESPMHEGYDQYTLKLNDRATALVMEWADVIGFASYKILTRNTDTGFGNKQTKAISTGERLLHVEPNPAHCGGNRFGLQNMALDWSVFSDQLTQVHGA